MSGSEVVKGEEIIKKALKINGAFYQRLEIIDNDLKGKVVVPEDSKIFSRERWSTIMEHTKKLKDNPTCDLSFKPLGYQVSLKDMDELERLLK